MTLFTNIKLCRSQIQTVFWIHEQFKQKGLNLQGGGKKGRNLRPAIGKGRALCPFPLHYLDLVLEAGVQHRIKGL